MQRFTRVQLQIMQAIAQERSWQRRGLFQLCLDLGIDYRNAWRAVRTLEIRGLVTVGRSGARELSLALGPAHVGAHDHQNSTPRRGTAIAQTQITKHTAQGQSMNPSYPRPGLTPEEEAKYSKIAVRINAIPDQRLRLVYVAAMVAENVRLLKEVNEHRMARGLAPLPVYDPEKQ